MLALGAHTVNATPFDAANGGGRQGEPFEIDFMLTRGGVTAADPGGLLDGRPAANAGAPGGPLSAAGTGVSTNPTLIAGAPARPLASLPNPDKSSCACRVPGVGSAKAQRPWALGLLALGLLVWRRRKRAA